MIESFSIEADHSGPSFDFVPTGNSDYIQFRFYYDANNNGAFDAGEATIISPDVKVKPLNVLAFTFDISGAIGAFSGTTAAQRLAMVQAAVDVGVARLRMRNSEDDFRAAVRIVMSPHNFGFFANEVYTPTSSRPGGIRAGTSDQNDLFSDMPDKCIRFVSGWFDNNGNQTTQKGQGDVGGEKKALVAWSIMADDTIVHEIGHTLGLSHNDDDTMNIMHGGENDSPPGRDAASNKLTSGEADKFSFTTL